MADQSASSANFKSFLTEEQIEIERQRRQADWERVRSKDDPVEAPAEVFDNRSLYEKLKIQHDLKKKEFEDMWAAKNSIRGLEEDETDFLARIDRARAEKQRELKRLEQEEIEELKKAQKEMEIASSSNPRPTTVKQHVPTPAVNKQKQLLSGIVKRKSENSSSTTQSLKRPLENDDSELPARLPRLLVPGGRLPGIGPAEGFSDSSDSNESSDDDDGLSRYSNGTSIQTLAQRKRLVKQLQDIAAASTGGSNGGCE